MQPDRTLLHGSQDPLREFEVVECHTPSRGENVSSNPVLFLQSPHIRPIKHGLGKRGSAVECAGVRGGGGGSGKTRPDARAKLHLIAAAREISQQLKKMSHVGQNWFSLFARRGGRAAGLRARRTRMYSKRKKRDGSLLAGVLNADAGVADSSRHDGYARAFALWQTLSSQTDACAVLGRRAVRVRPVEASVALVSGLTGLARPGGAGKSRLESRFQGHWAFPRCAHFRLAPRRQP